MSDDLAGAADVLRQIPEDWAQPPKEMIGKLPKGGTQLDYVGHATVTRILLGIDPLHTLEPVCDERGIPIVEIVGKDAVMWGRLTVLGHTRMGVGTCPAGAFDRDKQLLSDLYRNCAMRFGIATALWSKEEWSQPVRYEVNVEPLATAEQNGTIKAALSTLGEVDKQRAAAWWQNNQFPSLKSGQLTQRQADAVIAELERLRASSPSGEGGDQGPEAAGASAAEREEVDAQSSHDAVGGHEGESDGSNAPVGPPPGLDAARAALPPKGKR